MSCRSLNSAVIAVILFTTSYANAGVDLGERQTNVSVAESMRDSVQEFREQVWLGDTGVAANVKTWARLVDTWLITLDSMWKDLAAVAPQDLTILRQQYSSRLNERDDELRRLLSQSHLIATRAANASYQLKLLRRPNWDKILYPDPFHNLDSGAAAMAKDFDTISTLIAQRSDRIRQIMPLLRHKVDLKIQSFALSWNVPQWQAAQKTLADFAAAEATLQPLTSEITHEMQHVQKLAADYKLFAARSTWLAMAPKCKDTLTTISQQSFPRATIDAATTSVENDCDAARQLALMMHTSPEIQRYYTQALVDTLSTRLRQLCTAGDSQANCSQAAWLNRIPPEKIAAMTEDNLQALETAWTQAEGVSWGEVQ